MHGAIAVGCVFALAACGDDDAGIIDVDGGVVGCMDDVDCDDGLFCNGTETCVAEACVPGSAPCEECDESSDTCGSCEDADGDGVTSAACGGTDCDDTDDGVYPGNTEVCDPEGVDEDCDPATFGFRDADGDGFADDECCNGDRCGDDCNDSVAVVHPGEAESCDTFDNDCDGMVDELVLETFHADEDGDGFGDPDGETQLACAVPPGFSAVDTDCDDDAASVNPAADEECNGVDDDCDGVDDNRPGGCTCETGDMESCGTDEGVCEAGIRTCVDGIWSACDDERGGAESCDGLDNDCDGETDEMLRVPCYLDVDNDGYAELDAARTMQCRDLDRASRGFCPVDFTERAPEDEDIDCDDDVFEVSPDATEVCNDVDDDCNGTVDDAETPCVCESGDTRSCGCGGTETCRSDGTGYGACTGESALLRCYVDADGDGYAPSTVGAQDLCGATCPDERTDRNPSSPATTDCDDGNPAVNPGEAEICDGVIDHDCGGDDDDDVCECVGSETRVCVLAGVDPDDLIPASACNAVTQTCTGGAWPGSCSSEDLGARSAEACDGSIDDDCDGVVDDGCSCTTGTTRGCGTTTGECSPGQQTCTAGGSWGSCGGSGYVGPRSESCNHRDDDCDGLVDDPWTACSASYSSTSSALADAFYCLPGSGSCTSYALSNELEVGAPPYFPAATTASRVFYLDPGAPWARIQNDIRADFRVEGLASTAVAGTFGVLWSPRRERRTADGGLPRLDPGDPPGFAVVVDWVGSPANVVTVLLRELRPDASPTTRRSTSFLCTLTTSPRDVTVELLYQPGQLRARVDMGSCGVHTLDYWRSGLGDELLMDGELPLTPLHAGVHGESRSGGMRMSVDYFRVYQYGGCSGCAGW